MVLYWQYFYWQINEINCAFVIWLLKYFFGNIFFFLRVEVTGMMTGTVSSLFYRLYEINGTASTDVGTGHRCEPLLMKHVPQLKNILLTY